MKIAFIVPSMKARAGAQNSAVWLAGELNRRGHLVQILTAEYDPGLWGSMAGAGIMPFQHRFDLSCVRDAAYLADFGSRASGELECFDLLVPHNYPSYIWVWSAKRANKKLPPAIWYCHEPPRWLYGDITDIHAHRGKKKHTGYTGLKKLEMEAILGIVGILCNSRLTADNVRKVYGRNAGVCYPGIPVAEAPKRKKMYYRMVTRLTPNKNVATVLQAMSILQENYSNRDIRLQIAGQGTDRDRLQSIISRLNLKNVEMAGFIDDSRLPGFYAGARAVLYVPLDEPFGLVPLEAGIQGTPVIASNHGGPTETVINGETGLLVNPLDAQEIVYAMVMIYDHPEWAVKMGEKARNRVAGNFSVQKFASRFECQTSDLLAKRGSGLI